MMEYIEKLNTKKEYTAPQMEVMDCTVQGALLLDCSSDGCGDVEVVG
ncbi:MAG: hypothetical protein IJ909_05850 [Fibrobacter sp.]|nr:hypothetical protein [Fibrobacter sp.]